MTKATASRAHDTKGQMPCIKRKTTTTKTPTDRIYIPWVTFSILQSMQSIANAPDIFATSMAVYRAYDTFSSSPSLLWEVGLIFEI